MQQEMKKFITFMSEMSENANCSPYSFRFEDLAKVNFYFFNYVSIWYFDIEGTGWESKKIGQVLSRFRTIIQLSVLYKNGKKIAFVLWEPLSYLF